MLTLAFMTDLHFGPEARFEGKLRKLSHHAARLTEEVVRELKETVKPELLVNLGDDIEDESYEADLERYRRCQALLKEGGAPVVNVAGNHDVIHLGKEELNASWGRPGEAPLYYSFDKGPFHFVVLHTLEKKDVDVSLPAAQLRWLEADLTETQKPTVVFMHHPASEQDLTGNRWFAKAPHLALVRDRRALRHIFEASRKVELVVNGHVHWNHLDVIEGIPYVSVQSLIENLDDDAPGRPAKAFAVARLEERRITVHVHGEEPARYQFERRR